MTDGPVHSNAGDVERRERGERLYEAARALAPDARVGFLADTCADDAALRTELSSLVADAESAEAFFESLAGTCTRSLAERTVGPYRILSCVGVGGMGAVFRARDTRLQRDVALKFLPPHVNPVFDAGKRIWLEARAAAALEHPNVCTVHEIGATEDGLPFIAMAFYEGETLRERLSRGPVPVAEAVRIASQVARGLGAAHARGIVHRDVKPGNIMLTPDGTVKLLDFGLAKLADEAVTGPGVTPGTVAYMSPEQARGDAVGPQTDLWSLGVVLHEMLTGRHPFRRGSDSTVLEAIAHAEPEPVRGANPQIPAVVERVVAKLLQKDPRARHHGAADLLAELEHGDAAVARRRVGPRSSHVSVRVFASLAIVLGAGIWMSAHGEPAPAPAGTAAAPASVSKTIAVLPFTNLSPGPEEDYFSDGLTEELIAVLARVQQLRVVARTSAFAFKDTNRDIREIGRALDVGAVLEGSVQRNGARVRVRARLVDAEDGFPLWSATYDREVTDVFAIQRDLAQNITSALQAGVSRAEQKRIERQPTSNPEAFALYQKGRYFWHQRTRASYERAVEYFQRAIEADPRFAAPHAGLAAVYSQQGMSGALAPDLARERVKASALRALELDASLAEAHSVLGVYLHVQEWDARGAEREHARAVELEPGQPAVHNYYGNFLRSLGRVEAAIAQHARAVELDPLAPAWSETLAFTLLRAGRRDEAYEHVRNALELDSTYWRAHAVLGNVHEAMHRPAEALRAFERANELSGSAMHRTRADIARVLAGTGNQGEARRLVALLRSEAARSGRHEPAVATALLALDGRAAALAWLEESFRERHPEVSYIGGDPRFLPFEDIPQFLDLLRRVGARPRSR